MSNTIFTLNVLFMCLKVKHNHNVKYFPDGDIQLYCYIGIDLDLSKPKGMPLGLKLHTYSFTTKYINMAKA